MPPQDLAALARQFGGQAASPPSGDGAAADLAALARTYGGEPLAPEPSRDERSTFARVFDAAFTPPEVVTRTAGAVADAIDSPSLERSPWRARLAGFAAGATEGLASLLTPGDATLTALGLGPLARGAQAVRGGAKAVNVLQQGANAASVLRGAERLADADSLGEAAAGVGQAALGAAGAMAGRRPASVPGKTPGVLSLPPGARFTAAHDGRVAEAGTSIPMTQAPDGSFVRGVPAEYARHEIAGLLPEGRTPIVTPPPPGSVPEPLRVSTSGGRAVPAVIASYDERGGPVYSSDPNATPARREVRGLLPAGPRFVAAADAVAEAGDGDALRARFEAARKPEQSESGARSVRPAVVERDVDPTVPARDAVRVRQYSSDPDAVDAPFVDADDRRMLTTMRDDLETFAPERGRLINDPHDPGFARYSPGTAGSAVADDVRVISQQNVSNRDVLAAVTDLLEDKPPTNRLHTAALDAARGYRERRPGYRGPAVPMARGVGVDAPAGGGEPVQDEGFAAFSRMFDEVEPSAGREPGEEGFIAPQLAAHLGGGAAGAAYGAATGEDSEDRIKRGVLYGLAGAAAPSMFRRTPRGPMPGIVSGLPRANAQTAVPGVVARAGGPSVRPVGAGGRPSSSPMRGVNVLLDKFKNPLVRSGIEERLNANQAFTAQRRGTIPQSELPELAAQVRVDVSKALPKGTGATQEAVSAYASAVRQTQEEVSRLSALVNSGNGTDADVLRLERARADADVVLKSLMGMRAEAGRALASFRFLDGIIDSHNSELIRGAADQMRNDTREFARQFGQQPADPMARYQWLKQQGKPTWWDTTRSYYYSGILSGVRTHERNILGNTFNFIGNLATQPVAAGVDAVRAARTGAARTVRVGELPHSLVGAAAGVERGFQDALFALREGVSPEALGRSLESAASGKFDLPRVELAGGGRNPLNWPGRALDAADVFFRSLARNSEIYGAAYTQARNEGLDGQALIDRMAQLRAGQTPEGAALLAQADDVAARAVFQEKGGRVTSWLAQGYRIPGIGQAMTFVVPFLRTPSNILKQGLEASPAGFGMAEARAGGRRGAFGQGRAAAGTMAAGYLAWLASTGRLSGSGPRDADQRAALMEAGWRPNSIRVGDQWVSYQTMQPISVQAALVANAYEAWRSAGAKGGDMPGVIAQTLVRSANSFLDQSFMSGLFDLMDAMKEPESRGAAWGGRLAHSLTPLSGLQRTARDAMDGTQRAPRAFREQFKANTPGLSETVEPRIDRFGEAVRREGGPVRRALDPLGVSSTKRDSIADELSRLGVELSLPSRSVSGYTLTREQETTVQQARGRAVRQALERLMESRGYQSADDGGRAVAIERVLDSTHQRVGRAIRARLGRPAPRVP